MKKSGTKAQKHTPESSPPSPGDSTESSPSPEHVKLVLDKNPISDSCSNELQESSTPVVVTKKSVVM